MSWEPTEQMMQSTKGKRSGHAGFTLVELLVVIVILGILAGIVVFAVGGITDKGQTSACKADVSSLETAEERYFAQNSSYAAEATLVPQYIHEVSTMHDITLVVGPPPTYTVTVQGGGGC